MAVENEKISQNPVCMIKNKIESGCRIRFLSDEEENILLNYLREHYPEHVAAFLISVHTGLRAGEQFRMQWKDVDFERRILTIPKTKNGDIRHIDINETALAALKWLYNKKTRKPWVFLNSQGGTTAQSTRLV